MSALIPYISEPRPDTGLTNAKLGVWLFLASEVMLFGALFSTYVLLRVGGSTWPNQSDTLNVPLAFANTLVLIASSFTMVMAWASISKNMVAKFKLWMSITVALGGAFCVIKVVEYSQKFSHHLYPSSNTFLAIYFTLTGLHAFHVVCGMACNTYLLGPGLSMYKHEPERFVGRVEISGLFWHFVDLVWIFLFPVLYLL